MNELHLIIFSLLFFVAIYFTSSILIKLFKITHPKNKSLIYMIVMLSAFTVFFVPCCSMITTLPSSNQNAGLNPEMVIYSMSAAKKDTYVIKDSSDNDMNFTSDLFPYILRQNDSEINNYTTGVVSLVSTPPAEALPVDINNTTNSYTTGAYKNDKKEEKNLMPLFWQFHQILMILCIGFLIFTLAFGKRYLLYTMRCSKCEDQKILKMIKAICQEYNIKMPQIYTYDGIPNAFVFCHPITLIFSTELLHLLKPEEQKLVFQHELTHIKNKDIIIKPILQSLRILFIYNPLIHIVYKYIMENRELLADSFHMNSKKEKIRYMETLIKIEYHVNLIHNTRLSDKLKKYYTIPLFPNKEKKYFISKRYDNIFNTNINRTYRSFSICFLILFFIFTFVTITSGLMIQQENSAKIDGYPTIELGSMHVVAISISDGLFDNSDNFVRTGGTSESEEPSVYCYDIHLDKNSSISTMNGIDMLSFTIRSNWKK